MELLKKVACANCGTPLDLDPDIWLMEGSGGNGVTCPNCHMINRVRIILDGPPTKAIAKLTVRKREFAWNVKSMASLSDEQVIEKLKNDVSRIADGKNNEQPTIKALIRQVVLLTDEVESLKKKVGD